ncbi:M48 family metalloprotease [Shewanella sp. NIFS-20-20]|nr:M48 family metalloprotease [Shewanella sp. NIFS-20-20]
MRIIRGSAPVINDPVLSQYLTELGNRLVAHATGVKTPFYFFLLNNDEINAFAFFGGHVGVHTGLFLNADNESELASVLAHEITHVTQRHLARGIEAQQKATPATIAGILGGILLAIAAPQAGMAALATTQAMAQQSSINFTRLHEKEADRIGTQVMVEAGFDPNGAADFFAKLATRYRFTTKQPQMLLTHPLPESRITEARSRANQYPPMAVPASLNYDLAKARVQVRFSGYSDDAVLIMFDEQLKKNNYQFKQAALYGKSLALFRNERYQEAETIIDGLLAQDGNNLFYLDTKTDLLLQRHAFEDAIHRLSAQRSLKPSSQVINLNLANTYIEAKQAQLAIPILQEMVFLDKQNPLPLQLLTQAYKVLGNKAMEHYVRAESLGLIADYSGAIDQLNYAYRASEDNPLEQARIDARIRQFKQLERSLDQFK